MVDFLENCWQFAGTATRFDPYMERHKRHWHLVLVATNLGIALAELLEMPF